MKRKDFLQLSTLASGTLFMPKFLQAFNTNTLRPQGSKILIVLQFSGGNDGLNTIIPYTNDLYYSNRKSVSIKKDLALRLTDDAGINPNLSYFKTAFDNGEMSIVNNVGYPNPDRSHFRSMDIIQSASDSKQYLSTGWLGRYLDAQCTGCEKPTQILELDDILSLAMKGNQNKGIAFQDINTLYNSSQEKYFRQLQTENNSKEEVVDYLYKTLGATLNSADYIYKEAKLKPTKQNYPSTALGKKMKTIASLILSNINTQIYYVSIGSFDTHVNQQATQKRLFTEINDALKSFANDMKANNLFEDTLVMTFSEFGRRVKENASGGTDHGTANQMMFLSGGLKQKGLVNELSDLKNLDEGDLKHSVDFRQVYATVLKKWLGVDDEKILNKKHSYLNFI